MAARRLIAVLLVLLFLSSLAAALAPVETREDSQGDSTPVESPSTAPQAAGGVLLSEKITARAQEPPIVRATAGDQLQLTVRVDDVATIAVEEFGEADDADPLSPARFDLFLTQAGSYSVTILETGREVAKIEVAPQ